MEGVCQIPHKDENLLEDWRQFSKEKKKFQKLWSGKLETTNSREVEWIIQQIFGSLDTGRWQIGRVC
jgi:hypothetical protein